MLLQTPGMVTITIHVKSNNVCGGSLFDEQLYKSWTSFPIRTETLQNWSSIEYDRSGLSCDKYAALITTLRHLVCNASNCGDIVNTFSSFFLTDGVVTPFALSNFNDLKINSACLGSGSNSIQLCPPLEFQRTYRFRTYFLGVIAFCTKNCSNFYRILITHRTFNFTQRFTVTQNYEVVSVHHHR